MNKKKLVALGLIVVLLLTAIGGTLAYFTDTDEATNVMTVGNVKIKLRESGEINGTLLEDEDYRAALEEYELMPGITVDKNVWVDNVGSQPAYIRVVITVPTDLEPTWAEDLSMWEVTNVGNTRILESKNPVPGKSSTGNILLNVTLKDDLDQNVVASKYEIPINVYAIQSIGFDSADKALAALEAQTGVYLAEDQAELKQIINNATDAVSVMLPAGEYTLPALTNKNVTISGSKDTVIDTTASMPSTNGAELAFEGVTVNFKEGGQFDTNGFTHSEKVVYENCTINGTQFLYSEAEFINCTFNVEGDAYAVWTYGSPKATFTDCTFNTSGKAILVYIEKAHTATITVDGCAFNCDGAGYSKAAVEVGESAYGNKANYTLIINKSTADEGFTINKSTSNLWGNKNDMPADRLKVVLNGNVVDITPPVVQKPITTAAGLIEVLENVTDAGSGSSVINIEADIDLTGETWTPYKIDGYHGADIIIINGNGHTISGLTAPLFAGGFAGGSGIVINDLTIKDSTIVSTNTLGSGAFIECVDSMDVITLNNCHLLKSSVSGSRTGGLIGWNSGYNNINDGSVKTTVTIEDCTVVDCEITGNGTVGGIVGHAGANPWTWNNITNCKVENTKLTSNDDSYRVGAIVGTANVGEVVITGCTSTGNTFLQNNNGTEITRPEGQSELYGRFVPQNGSGKLTIDGKEIQ